MEKTLRYDVVVCTVAGQQSIMETNVLKDAKKNADWYAKRHGVCVQVFDNTDDNVVYCT